MRHPDKQSGGQSIPLTGCCGGSAGPQAIKAVCLILCSRDTLAGRQVRGNGIIHIGECAVRLHPVLCMTRRALMHELCLISIGRRGAPRESRWRRLLSEGKGNTFLPPEERRLSRSWLCLSISSSWRYHQRHSHALLQRTPRPLLLPQTPQHHLGALPRKGGSG